MEKSENRLLRKRKYLHNDDETNDLSDHGGLKKARAICASSRENDLIKRLDFRLDTKNIPLAVSMLRC